MILQIPGVLNPAEIDALRGHLRRAAFEDGAMTAGPVAREVKKNLQLSAGSEAARTCAPVVLEALRRNVTFFSAALPLRVHGPVFNRYDPGMTYGEHVDNAIMGLPGAVRSDVAATVFLSPPEDYDGGELTVQDTLGAHRIKLAAGSVALYPGTSIHQVAPIGRGTRLAAVLWVQSLVRDATQRRLLFDLDMTIGSLREKLPGSPQVNVLTGVYHNLLRLWSET